MPSDSPTITMARPNNSGRSLIAAIAAEPVYATAIAAPIDEPATAMAAPISAEPFADVVAAATVWAEFVTEAPDDGVPVRAMMNSAPAESKSTPFTASRIRTARWPRLRTSQLADIPPTINAGNAIIQVNMTPPWLSVAHAM